MTRETTAPEEEQAADRTLAPAPEIFALVIVWCREEAWRVGETLLVPRGSVVSIGRGAREPKAAHESGLEALITSPVCAGAECDETKS